MERLHVTKANGKLKQNYYVVNHKLEEWFHYFKGIVAAEFALGNPNLASCTA